jgi:hypothetical protein
MTPQFQDLKPEAVDREFQAMLNGLKDDYEHSDEERRLELACWLADAIENPPGEDMDYWGSEGFRPWWDR